jgi:DNA-binding FadR family transcriptional regulator
MASSSRTRLTTAPQSGAMVRVSMEAHERLRALAADSGETMQAIVTHAILAYWRQRIIEGTVAAYAALRADAETWQAMRAEDAEWEATLADGLEND